MIGRPRKPETKSDADRLTRNQVCSQPTPSPNSTGSEAHFGGFVPSRTRAILASDEPE